MIPLSWQLGAGAALLAAAAAGGYQVASKRWEVKMQAEQLAWAAERDSLNAAAITALEQARKTEADRIATLEGIANEARTDAAAARAAAARAKSASAGLRERAAELAARCDSTAGDPSPAAGGKASAGPGLVLARLFKRADETAGELAEAYDAARVAGVACERAYDSLRQKEESP